MQTIKEGHTARSLPPTKCACGAVTSQTETLGVMRFCNAITMQSEVAGPTVVLIEYQKWITSANSVGTSFSGGFSLIFPPLLR